MQLPFPIPHRDSLTAPRRRSSTSPKPSPLLDRGSIPSIKLCLPPLPASYPTQHLIPSDPVHPSPTRTIQRDWGYCMWPLRPATPANIEIIGVGLPPYPFARQTAILAFTTNS
ncbi:hypothetical protein EJ06DRAFT_330530 [Trichodelitschia bisporula]|uniref:Uncharacterized protein n=1 Tax=Trichodelitschia bisporula TaxID=703511 RepID=A0A6G1I1W3_9PEZI|nr:hypothetical protein EJ06DRAFT_330530 [Trichodelitschia bisporula]